ncbi:hypothetical protein SAMN02745824_0924 [Parasphingorhabdus marina DSM 22363]|uniref:Lipoprotein n=1 Tax=Parasphingorhabdus marina DSM 22363 TaxID=1123272 RepID=A0A1N6CSU9_9SPHN|nr:hypothetical protein [Parasphingorhabdus marina]SIN61630.1 hypothetical protein SAMN02745824_0924 [Parasphingorhabdus marina DSM 22363]
MKHFVRIIAAASAPLLLSGCFLLPGKFDANLKILDGDRYEFSYAGEIQITLPDEGKAKKPSSEPFDPDKLKCRDRVYKSNGEVDPTRPVYGNDYDQYADEVTDTGDAESESSSNRLYDVVARECTADEIADRKSQYDADQARKQKRYDEEAAMAGALFGGPIPGDEESLKAFAAQLGKYAGWEKVEHAGGNIFNVEFRETGTIGNYFSFPVLPDAQMQYPFFQLMRRNDGAIELLTPSIAGQGGLFNMMMMKEGGGKGAPEISEIDGTLTVETNGTVASNNSADGFVESGGMKVMQWKIGKNAESEDGPRVLIRF